jgi:hypothetical protein
MGSQEEEEALQEVRWQHRTRGCGAMNRAFGLGGW